MKTKILSPLRRNGYKAGMIMMLIALSTMLLTTACSSEDDLVNNTANTENTINKGYALPVTVNVTRQGDATTRATYNEGTKKLGFSTGDELLVNGTDKNSNPFAGTLTWTSGGTFTGTITTTGEYTGTADDLFKTATLVNATLLPNNYGNYHYLSLTGSGASTMLYNPNVNNTFTTTKAEAVEQYSYEHANTYTSGTGFVLSPQNAILNFTITGLTPSTNVTATLTGAYGITTISGTVTTDGSGNAIFAMALGGGADLNDFTLTVGGHDFPLASSSKEAQAGKIYNISRNGAKTLAEVGNEDLGKVIAADGKVYANATAATAAGTTARAIITYVGSATGEGSPYNHGLALALTNVSGDRKMWKTEQSDASHNHKPKDINSFQSESGLQYNSTHNNTTYPAFKAAMDYSPAAPTTYGCSVWFLPTAYQWKQMIDAADSWENLRTRANLSNGYYWTSSEYNTSDAWCIYSSWAHGGKNVERFVRSALAF